MGISIAIAMFVSGGRTMLRILVSLSCPISLGKPVYSLTGMFTFLKGQDGQVIFGSTECLLFFGLLASASQDWVHNNTKLVSLRWAQCPRFSDFIGSLMLKIDCICCWVASRSIATKGELLLHQVSSSHPNNPRVLLEKNNQIRLS